MPSLAAKLRSRLTHTVGLPHRGRPYVPTWPPPDVHVAVLGDVGGRLPTARATARVVGEVDAGRQFDAVLLLGDNAYPSGDPARLDVTVFTPLAGVLAHADLLGVLGNHDLGRDDGAGQLALLGVPGRWWVWRRGPLRIVGLDSNHPGDGRQRRFLEQTLARTTHPWTVVALHHPPYSAGYQGSSLDARDAFAGVLARHRVPLVLSGHDHDYQRSAPVDGVTYVVSGGASRTRRTGRAPFTARSFSTRHFVELAATRTRLVVRAVDHRGRVVDELALDAPAATRSTGARG